MSAKTISPAGWRYLVREVASNDAARVPGQDLAGYYLQTGNQPGRWVGRLAEAEGLTGRAVSEEGMRALFGDGCHPVTGEQLGNAFPTYRSVEDRILARVATEPDATAERRDAIAAEERRKGGRTATSGRDHVFSPVKSVSLLWALGSPEVAGEVEAAHEAAWRSTLGQLEEEVTWARDNTGTRVRVTGGVIGAAFDHRDSRSGDPDLHTHVAVSVKVRREDGSWSAMDSQTVHHHIVALSERYNTRLEDGLRQRLGVTFSDRAGTGRDGKRSIREIDGVPVELIGAMSSRRRQVEDNIAALTRQFEADQHRVPSRREQEGIAQQAVCMGRPRKEEVRSLGAMRAEWHEQAVEVLGADRVAELEAVTLGRHVPTLTRDDVDSDRVARTVVAGIAEGKSTWTRPNVIAETERALRPIPLAAGERDRLVTAVVDRALSADLSITVDRAESLFGRYTSGPVLEAEERLLAAAGERGSYPISGEAVEAAIERHGLTTAQAVVARTLCSSDRQLIAFEGPAGAGKTRTLRAVVDAARTCGRPVYGLTMSAEAADELATAANVPAENIAKWRHEHDAGAEGWTFARRQLLIVDEGSTASTLDLDRLRGQIADVGGTMIVVGDPHQHGSPDAGGLFALLAQEPGAAQLGEVLRFEHAWEADASLRLRAGDTSVVDEYLAQGRVRSGSAVGAFESAICGWREDDAEGKRSVLLAATRDQVAALADRARELRVEAGRVDDERTVDLATGSRAGRGDLIIATQNDRRVRVGSTWVRNGQTWAVENVGEDGSLDVRLASGRARLTLPADYVAHEVALAYARTTHIVQSRTVDTTHTLVDPDAMSRQGLYVGATRGRESNTMHVVTEQLVGLGEGETPRARTVEEVLARVVERDARERSASEILRAGLDQLGPEEITRLREERERLRSHLEGPDVPVEPSRHEQERAAELLAAAQRRVAQLESGTEERGRFGKSRTVIDEPALGQARGTVAERTRTLDAVTERAERWERWRAGSREDQALARDVDRALASVVNHDGRDDRALDLAREQDLHRDYGWER